MTLTSHVESLGTAPPHQRCPPTWLHPHATCQWIFRPSRGHSVPGSALQKNVGNFYGKVQGEHGISKTFLQCRPTYAYDYNAICFVSRMQGSVQGTRQRTRVGFTALVRLFFLDLILGCGIPSHHSLSPIPSLFWTLNSKVVFLLPSKVASGTLMAAAVETRHNNETTSAMAFLTQETGS